MNRTRWALAAGRHASGVGGLALSLLALSILALAASCARNDLVVVQAAHWKTYVYEDNNPWADGLESLHFRPSNCQGLDLSPSYKPLTEEHLVTFLRDRGLKVSVERPRSDLVYVTVENARTRSPARLRVAILPSTDEAATELAVAIDQHGQGSWGVHRSNLAVLGPVGETEHDLAFAAQTQLVCWGVFTLAATRGPVVIPGGYREL